MNQPLAIPRDAQERERNVVSQRLRRLKARRKLWLDVHLWLGLVLGLFLAVFGLTGSVLVFYDELDAVLDHDLFAVEVRAEGEAAFRPMAEILAAAEAAAPLGSHLNTVTYPPQDGSTYRLFYENAGSRWQVFVDPYTTEVLGQRLLQGTDEWFPHHLIPFVFKLHYALLADDTGVLVVGVMSVLLVFSILTGLIVWWPLTGNWKRALSIKPRASVERFNHDLHQASGFYTALVLLAVLVSGVYMNLPKQFLALVQLISPATRDFKNTPSSSGTHAGQKPIGLTQAVAIAGERYPEGRLSWLSLPKDEHDVYTIRRMDVPELSRFWSERAVQIDPYSGTIVAIRDPAVRRSAGETFIDWQWPLHSGKAFGWPGRIAVFVTGLACPVLFVTGVIRWLQKRQARAQRPRRSTGMNASTRM